MTLKHGLVVLFIMLSLQTRAQVNFVSLDFADAVTQAQKDQKLLFVDFRADWCKPCIEMEKTTFQDSSLGVMVNQSFICLKADVDEFKGMDLKDKYNVNSYPTILVIDPLDESVQLRMIGYKTAQILRGDLQMVLDFYKEEEVTDEPDPVEPASDQTTEPKKKRCFLIRWLDKITE